MIERSELIRNQRDAGPGISRIADYINIENRYNLQIDYETLQIKRLTSHIHVDLIYKHRAQHLLNSQNIV